MFRRLCFAAYDCVLLAVLALCFPLVWRRIRPEAGFPGDWRERFGFLPAAAALRKAGSIWIQTVSVGELLSVTPLIGMLRERHPDRTLILTVTTKTGRRIAAKNFPDIPCFFFPADLPPIVRAAFRALRPRVVVLVETELWPGLLRTAAERRVPVVIVNGRISPKSFRRYRRLRFFTRLCLPLVAEAVMRSEGEAERLAFLGLPRPRISLAGSVKFDQALSLGRDFDPAAARRKLGIAADRKVVILGSLHPGEEEEAATAAREMLEKRPGLLAIVVPRFLDRTGIFRILARKGMACARRSRFPENADRPLWVVDTYGELTTFYGVSDAAFVGGSLTPWGGQNPIEPAAFGRPVVFGPHNWHFAEEWRTIRDAGGGVEVRDWKEAVAELLKLLDDPAAARAMGRRALDAVGANTGATERNVRAVERHLR